jgi:cytosine/creatinine deaminase
MNVATPRGRGKRPLQDCAPAGNSKDGAMLLLRRARVPAVLLPPALASAPVDPFDPAVLCDVSIAGDRIVEVVPSGPPGAGGDRVPPPDSVDLGGVLVFPGLVDAHVHLDKAHTWLRAPNPGGTFAEALDILARDRVNWSAADLRHRADFALRCAWAHGTRLIRTHVDIGLPWGETVQAAMAGLREHWRGRIELQTVPLCGGDLWSGADGEALADLALRHGASALGGFLAMSRDLQGQIGWLMDLARERRVGLDLHVDENGDPGAEVLRAVAEAVVRTEFPHPVVCGHCCSLAVQPSKRQRETIGLVKAAGIGVISLPMCNLYLQDRRGAGFPRTQFWRGLTLIRDLLDAGVPVACASDNVRDAFHAFGDLDAVEVYAQSVRLAHLDARLSESVRVVTTTAADLLGRPEFGRVGPGAPAHLVVFAARSFSELLSRPSAARRLVDGELVHLGSPPDYAELG